MGRKDVEHPKPCPPGLSGSFSCQVGKQLLACFAPLFTENVMKIPISHAGSSGVDTTVAQCTVQFPVTWWCFGANSFVLTVCGCLSDARGSSIPVLSSPLLSSLFSCIVDETRLVPASLVEIQKVRRQVPERHVHVPAPRQL